MYRLNVKLSDELGVKIDEISKRHSMSKTAIVANALSQYAEILDVQYAVMEKIKADPSIVKKMADAMGIE